MKKIVIIVFAVLVINVQIFANSNNVNTDQTGTGILFNEGRSGEIYGGLRWPAFEEDDKQWLTLKMGEGGVRIVSQDGKNEILAIDNYGGVYLHGDTYLNGELLEVQSRDVLIYGLVVLSLVMNIILIFKHNELSKKIRISNKIK